MSFNGVDLWAGIGGVSSGWRESRIINPLFSVECNPTFLGLSSAYKCTHAENFPNGTFLKMPIETWASLNFPGLKEDVFISHGSPPCQHFSQATRGMKNRPQENAADQLGAKIYADFLENFLPPYFTLEQVVDYQQSESFKTFYERVGWFYNIQVYRVNLMHYGIPQDRLRLFVTGNRFTRKPLELHPMRHHQGWFSTLRGLDLRLTTLTEKQKAIARLKGHKTLLLPRVNIGTARLYFEPYPTILRSHFTDQKNSSRYEPFSCLVDGSPYAVPLRALARGQGFFNSFKLPRLPVIAGSGVGNAFSPQFIHDFIIHNFKK